MARNTELEILIQKHSDTDLLYKYFLLFYLKYDGKVRGEEMICQHLSFTHMQYTITHT